jgi:hypothetical protein
MTEHRIQRDIEYSVVPFLIVGAHPCDRPGYNPGGATDMATDMANTGFTPTVERGEGDIENLGLRVLKSEKGIALVMVLILALISLAIVSAMLFIVTQGTVISGAQKFYRSAEEASVGAAELSTEYMSNRGTFTLLGVSLPNGCNCGDPTVATDNTELIAGVATRTCRCDKMCNSTSDWWVGTETYSCDENTGVAGLQVDVDPKTNPDFSYPVGNYRVYTKIVDTVRGNSDVGGIVASGELGGSSVSSSTAGVVTPPLTPYLYRMELLAEAAANPRERSKISVLFAY